MLRNRRGSCHRHRASALVRELEISRVTAECNDNNGAPKNRYNWERDNSWRETPFTTSEREIEKEMLDCAQLINVTISPRVQKCRELGNAPTHPRRHRSRSRRCNSRNAVCRLNEAANHRSSSSSWVAKFMSLFCLSARPSPHKSLTNWRRGLRRYF